MRCLGIDYGERRWGLAYGDELGVAIPLPALVEREEAARWDALRRVAAERRISDLVLGMPYNMDGTEGFKAQAARKFAGKVTAALGVPVHWVDERLTSYEAESTIAPERRRKLRGSGVVDSRAAALILRDFLEQRFPSPPGPEHEA